MKINLITPVQHTELLNVYNNTPVLTLQNTGYEEIKKENLTDEEKLKHREVSLILEKTIIGFSRFQNFKVRKNGDIAIRFQYDYCAEEERPTHSFTGVGYILLDELLNGFNS